MAHYRKNEATRDCMDSLRLKVTMIEAGHGRAAFSSLKSQSKGGLRDRFRGLAQDELPLPAPSLVESLTGMRRA